jgi:hypothetical protein
VEDSNVRVFLFYVPTLKNKQAYLLLAKEVLEDVPCVLPHSGYGLGSHTTVCVRPVAGVVWYSELN